MSKCHTMVSGDSSFRGVANGFFQKELSCQWVLPVCNWNLWRPQKKLGYLILFWLLKEIQSIHSVVVLLRTWNIMLSEAQRILKHRHHWIACYFVFEINLKTWQFLVPNFIFRWGLTVCGKCVKCHQACIDLKKKKTDGAYEVKKNYKYVDERMPMFDLALAVVDPGFPVGGSNPGEGDSALSIQEGSRGSVRSVI